MPQRRASQRPGSPPPGHPLKKGSAHGFRVEAEAVLPSGSRSAFAEIVEEVRHLLSQHLDVGWKELAQSHVDDRTTLVGI